MAASMAVCSKCKGDVPADAERCMHCGAWFGPNRNAVMVLKIVGLCALLILGLLIVLSAI